MSNNIETIHSNPSYLDLYEPPSDKNEIQKLGRLVATEGLSKSEQLSRLMGSMTDDEMKVLGLSDMVIEKIKEALKQSHKQRENHDRTNTNI